MILLLETVHPDADAILSHHHEVARVSDLDLFDPGSYPGVRALVTRGRGRVTAEVLAALPDLEVVARCGAGLDNIDTDAAARVDVTVVHAPGMTTTAVAEHALMLMLAVSRRLPEVDGAVKAGNWKIREGFLSTELAGKKLGIVGLGAIGTRLARLGEALGMTVMCSTRRSEKLTVPHVELDELLVTADVIQICLPLSDATRGLFDAEAFARMKPTAILINTARGPIVNHSALADALEDGRLAGYGADVWDPEPPVDGDRVLSWPTTVVTPHVAGLTDLTYRAICVGPAEAVVAILDGDQPNPSMIKGRKPTNS